MKLKIGSGLIALMGLFAGSAAWGDTSEEIEAATNTVATVYSPGLGTMGFNTLQAAFDAATNENCEVQLVRSLHCEKDPSECESVIVCNKCTFVLDKYLLSNYVVIVRNGGDLDVICNDVGPEKYNFIGTFDVRNGALRINGGVMRQNYTVSSSGDIDRVYPMVSTVVEGSNTLEFVGTTFYGIRNSAIELNGNGSFRMEKCAVLGTEEKVIAADKKSYYYITNRVDYGVKVLGGTAEIVDSEVEAQVTAVSFGDNDARTGIVAPGCSGTNRIAKTVLDCETACAVYAVASSNGYSVLISDTDIAAVRGVELVASADVAVEAKSTLTLEGNTTITTIRDKNYAVADWSKGAAWDIAINSGTYYRMKKSVVEDGGWCGRNTTTWSPETGDDNLRLTVTKGGRVQYIVNFHDDDGAFFGSLTNLVEKGTEWSVAGITPQNTFAVTNDAKAFSGWYDAKTNRTETVRSPDGSDSVFELFAGWQDAFVTFEANNTNTAATTGWVTPFPTGVAWAVVNGNVDFSKISPNLFGWTNDVDVFTGWFADTNGTRQIDILPLPVVTNVYAHWMEKSRPGDICRIEGVTNKTYSIEEAMAVADGRTIILFGCMTNGVTVTADTRIQVESKGSVGSAGVPLPYAFVVDKNGTLDLENNGTVYGSIVIGDGATVRLKGGQYVFENGAVVWTDDDCQSYLFEATGASFTGGPQDDDEEGRGVLSLSGSGTNCIARLHSSTVATTKAADTGIYQNGCRLDIEGTMVRSSEYGIYLDNTSSNLTAIASNLCEITEGSIIESGMFGVYAFPSTIRMADSAISGPSPAGCAFRLVDTNGVEDIAWLRLEGTNVVEGGSNEIGKVRDGLFVAGAKWTNRIEITGGTYAHIASNATTVAQVQKWAEGCVVTWLSDSCFSVFDPLSVAYRISYVTNGIPAGAVLGTNENPVVYTAASNFTFTAMTCVSVTNASLVATADWYLVDPPTVYSNLAASAIYDGQLYLYDVQGKTNVFSGVSCTNITLKTGEWTWREPPTPPSGDITIYFKTGVADPEDPESHDSEVDWNYESEEHAGPWPKIDEEYASGVDFPTNLATHTLPTATWKGHKFNGWQAYVIEEDEENVKTNYMGTVFVDTISLEDLRKVEEEYDGNLHAVWDRGGSGGGGISSFDELFNMDDLPPLTGGDTYVGYIHDGGVSVGTITIKCGVPQADGRVPITAIVQEIGKPTRTFKGWGTYNGDTITVDELVNGEDSLSMDINSKMATGSYNGYSFEAGVNGFKGSEEAKDAAEQALEPWLGKWMLVFATTESGTSYDGEAETDVDGQAFAWGYSHVLVDIREKGKVVMSGKLASGKEVSATATAIVGDNGVCIPAVCSIYSGYDWWRCGGDAFGDYLMLDALGSDLAKMYMKKTNRGGFGFTAWFSRTNDTDYVNVNNVSEWDSTKDKSMPFIATVAYTNHQRVAAIELPATGSKDLEFCVDMSRPGWLSNTDRLGDIGPGEDYIPANPSNTVGYVQFVNVTGSTSSNGTATVEKYAMKAANKAPKMKLVDGSYIVPNKGGSNYANLKLKYKSDKGLFSGSFKVYSVVTDDETGDTKLKKTKVAVSGGIAEGRGYGVGYADKVGSQPVLLVKPSEADKLLNDESEAKSAAEDDEDDSADKEEGPSES